MLNAASLQSRLFRAQSLQQAGRLPEAWTEIAPLRSAIDQHGQALRLYALIAQGIGQIEMAIEALRQIIDIERDPPEIVGALANLLGKAGRHDAALAQWDRLVALQPNIAEAHLNRAIAASDAGQPTIGVRAAEEGLRRFPGHSRLMATRAMALQNAGRLEDAAVAFEQAVAADPDRALTRHNQAVSLRSLSRFEEACDAFKEARRLGMKGVRFYANWAAAALEAGRVDEARSHYAAALADDPLDPESLKALTRLHIEYRTGEDPFAHVAGLADSHGGDPNFWLNWANALAGNRRFEDAETVAARGLERHPADQNLRIVRCFSKGITGDPAGPAAELEALYKRDPTYELLWGTLSQLGLRAGHPEIAAETAGRMVAKDPLNQSALSILSIAWRLLGDPRELWLCDYERLVMEVDVPPPDGSMTAADYARVVSSILRPLHTTLEAPGDQSLRDGTQTSGSLFDNPDEAIQRFRQAVTDAAARAVGKLPDDANHPFLSRKAKRFAFSGSWSVRLRAGGGHHVPHFHSEGWMSSAYYARLPERSEGASPNEGWIEFGRPPPVFKLDLPPRRLVEPKEGKLVLFPSYMWHGTIPFGAGERLTAAFDYQPLSAT
ncbi:MAG: putative 2OG-Fe(II) oxygenase [Pseudomonadota bacterium]